MDATLNDTLENMEADYSNKASTEENEDNKISPNLYAEEARQRYMGEFNIPLSAINFASESKAIRKLNTQHLAELFANFNSNLLKKPQINETKLSSSYRRSEN
ncbi:uncharacterized protein [Magallana gigas]|uniref:uncharacterized protein n=1 Tax=Magallana gigas TaxID=29159 RepID=UPI00333FBC7C